MNLADLFIAKKLAGGGGGGTGTDNYNDLSNKPQINSTALTGDKSASDLGLQSEIDSDNKISADYVDDTSASNKFVSAAEKLEWSGKQDAIDADHKIDADYVDDTTSDNKFVTASDKTAWNAKQNAIDSSHKLSSDLVDDTGHTNLFVTSTEKSTWNGKQDKIDSSHKLSSTLVSFDSSEAAALASGIDSSKVEQISTNQTNILYALNTGAKNLFRWNKWVNDCTVVGGTKSISSDGVMTLAASSSNCYTEYEGATYPDVEIEVKENEQYILTWEYGRQGGSGRGTVYVVFVNSTGAATASVSAEYKKIEFTTPTGTTGLRIYINQTSSGLNEYYYNFMVCSKVVWDTLGHDYQPPSVPNYDLTRMMTPFFTVPINHNMIYRGQNLGDTLTDEQHTALSSGNFTDLYLGDYWTKTVTIPAGTYTGGDEQEVTVPAQTNITLKAVIADFDTFYAGYASGYAAINTHHAAVIVTGFNNVVWNSTNTTAGGYAASLIHKWLVGSALPQIETWFGSDKVLSHQKRLTNAITGDAASGWAWSSQKISLLSENQMYGSKVWGNSKATNGAYEPSEAFKHLNVFNHIDANLLFGNKNIWLRDIGSARGAADLVYHGYASSTDASDSTIAPAALILLS